MTTLFRAFIRIFLLTLFYSQSYSQSKINSELLSKYIDTVYEKRNSNFYAVEVNNKTPHNIINLIKLYSLRSISDKEFIIEEGTLSKYPEALKFFKRLNTVNNLWKLSPAAEKLSLNKSDENKTFRFIISLKNFDSLKKQEIQKFLLNKRNSFSNHQSIVSIVCPYREIEKTFLNNDNVFFIDVITQKPHEELATKGFDLSANKINQVHSQYSLINGSSQNVSIKENFYDTTDIDLKNRLLPSSLASNNITNHANYIATIIAGGGNSEYNAKGAAWAANISSSSFEQVLPDENNYYVQNNITVQNHSYGTDIDNSYGLNAVAFDKSANENPDLLHVFSSGNSGDKTTTTGTYSGVNSFANLTGNFKMAKNIMVVGAADSFGVVAPLSSKGPAYDGRIKPDLVAFERNGTSEAAALVSGTTLLLQQSYKTKNNSNALPSALAKAILINTADDVNVPGPDFATGFGNMNGIKAIHLINDNNIFLGKISNDSSQYFTINVPLNISKLKVTLTWNDTAATAFAPKALVNDLDLEVLSPSNEIWKPWVLSSFPDVDSLTALPQRKRDSLNNIEQVTIEKPVAGIYRIKISGYDIATLNQQYYVVYSFDSLNFFQWYFPSKIDFGEAGKLATLRWENSFIGNGTLEYNLLQDSNWLPVSQSVDLAKKYFTWTVPDTISPCLLRMKIKNQYFYSDTFLITTLLNPKVGYVCADSILLFWEKLKTINAYQLYRLGEKYMEPFTKVSDTSVILKANNSDTKYFAVAPVFFNGQAGAKSYAFDYTLQGIGCYIKTFLVNEDGNNARLSLSLGTIANVSNITFEKLNSSGYTSIYNADVNGNTDFNFIYQPLQKGINIFRAKIILSNGQIIYSGNESVYYVENGKYLVFPIPVKRNNAIEIFTEIPDEETIQLIDMMGRIVLQKQIQFPHEYLKTGNLQGQYFYRIIKKGQKVSSGRLLVL